MCAVVCNERNELTQTLADHSWMFSDKGTSKNLRKSNLTTQGSQSAQVVKQAANKNSRENSEPHRTQERLTDSASDSTVKQVA